MPQAQILVVDDEPDIRQLVKEILEDEGYSVQVAHDGESARLIFAQFKPDLTLLDIWMPDIDGISLLKEWSAGGELESPVVIMSGHGTLETAVEATRLGAFDFVQKPLSLAKLLATVRKALESKPASSADRLSTPITPVIEPLGGSPAMQLLRSNAKQAASHTASRVLISGEPGSGREALARYIHQLSSLAGNFVVLDRSQTDDENARSYLFGANVDGKVRPGLLAQAEGGSLFIPELQKLSAGIQELLENVLESGQYSPDGSTTTRHLDCRIICSAAVNLKQMVEDGQILNDLYFRLNMLPLNVPSLRSRPEDIPELVRYYADLFPNQENLPYRQFPVSIQNRMRNHSWPGNVRELRNLVQQLLVLGGDSEVSIQEVEDALEQNTDGISAGFSARDGLFDLPLREAREQFERDYLIYQLKKANGSVGRLAESVGMERTHLYRKLRSLGIDPKSVSRKRGST